MATNGDNSTGKNLATPDPVIEAYKKDIDRTLLRETLKLTPEARLLKLERFARAMREVRGTARRPRP